MMRISRRQILKGGAGGALALGALSAGAPAAHASKGRETAVHIHGVVTNVANPAVTLAISIDAARFEDNLAGAGWDSGTAGGPGRDSSDERGWRLLLRAPPDVDPRRGSRKSHSSRRAGPLR